MPPSHPMCLVLQEYKSYRERRPSRLTSHKIDLLDRLDFIWNAQKSGNRSRMGRYRPMSEYAHQIPSSLGPPSQESTGAPDSSIAGTPRSAILAGDGADPQGPLGTNNPLMTMASAASVQAAASPADGQEGPRQEPSGVKYGDGVLVGGHDRQRQNAGSGPGRPFSASPSQSQGTLTGMGRNPAMSTEGGTVLPGGVFGNTYPRSDRIPLPGHLTEHTGQSGAAASAPSMADPGQSNGATEPTPLPPNPLTRPAISQASSSASGADHATVHSVESGAPGAGSGTGFPPAGEAQRMSPDGLLQDTAMVQGEYPQGSIGPMLAQALLVSRMEQQRSMAAPAGPGARPAEPGGLSRTSHGATGETFRDLQSGELLHSQRTPGALHLPQQQHQQGQYEQLLAASSGSMTAIDAFRAMGTGMGPQAHSALPGPLADALNQQGQQFGGPVGFPGGNGLVSSQLTDGTDILAFTQAGGFQQQQQIPAFLHFQILQQQQQQQLLLQQQHQQQQYQQQQLLFQQQQQQQQQQQEEEGETALRLPLSFPHMPNPTNMMVAAGLQQEVGPRASAPVGWGSAFSTAGDELRPANVRPQPRDAPESPPKRRRKGEEPEVDDKRPEPPGA